MKFAIEDTVRSLRRISQAFHFAYGDTKARYRRSMLGPLWIVLGTAIGVVGLGYVWSGLLKIDRSTLLPSLTIGLIVWQFISGSITESSTVFVRNAAIIRNISTPFLIIPIQLLLKQFINFAHNALIIIAVLLVFPPPLSALQWLVIPGLILVIGNLLWMSLIIGMLGARFRDLDLLISSVMPLVFFLSPVLFRPDSVTVPAAILWLNPLTYLITIIRDPIEGTLPPLFVYAGCVAMLFFGWTLALWLFQKRGNRIAFWV